MVVTFKSRATGDVIMLGEHAGQLLKILGKDADARQGIITLEQLPEAIERLQRVLEEDLAKSREREAEREKADEDEDNPPPTGMAAPVSLYQRGWPLLRMLTTSHAEGTPVIWGS